MKGIAQITYADSCLKVEFYYQDKELKFDTLKTIHLETKNEIQNFFYQNDTSLHLIMVNRNVCNLPIPYDDDLYFDYPGQSDFTLEGQAFDIDSFINLDFCVEYDYFRKEKKQIKKFIKQNTFIISKFMFPLSMCANSKDLYRFRLRFNYQTWVDSNWLDDFSYSNWIYLKIE